MTRRHLISALALSLVGAVAPSAQPSSADRIRRIEHGLLPPVVIRGQAPRLAVLEERMQELDVPGVSVAVFEKGRIVWSRGWGLANVAERRRVDAGTLFQAGSISKPITAAAALALASSGRLALDQDINSYLTSWKVPENPFTAQQRVTLRHLLSHTGGMTVSGFRGYAGSEAVPTLLQVLDGVRPTNSGPVRVDLPVGSRWRYAGGGYAIVQLAIQDVTHQAFATVLRDLVLNPAGMSESTFAQPLPRDLHPRASTGYRSDGTPVAGGAHTYPELAAAGLWTTAEDLARFAMALQQAAAGTATRPLLPPQIARQMLQPVMDEYGLGVSISGTGREVVFGHTGGNAGFRCQLVASTTEASGVVVMTNGDRGLTIAAEIIRAVAAEYKWPSPRPTERTVGHANAADYPSFAGIYEIATRSPAVILAIETAGGKLYRSVNDQRTELLAENARTFFATDSDLRIEFVRDPSGKVTHARVWQGGIERTALRR